MFFHLGAYIYIYNSNLTENLSSFFFVAVCTSKQLSMSLSEIPNSYALAPLKSEITLKFELNALERWIPSCAKNWIRFNFTGHFSEFINSKIYENKQKNRHLRKEPWLTGGKFLHIHRFAHEVSTFSELLILLGLLSNCIFFDERNFIQLSAVDSCYKKLFRICCHRGLKN